MSKDLPYLIQLPKIPDNRGNLSFFENKTQVPFEIKRVYLVYDVPGGEYRGEHAFHNTCEVIIALSGSFDIVLNDGMQRIKYSLNRSDVGLYVPRMTWRNLENFSTNSLGLIAANTLFSSGDYIRDFIEFKHLRGEA